MTLFDASGRHERASRSPVAFTIWLGRYGQHGAVHVRRLGVLGLARLGQRMERARLQAVRAGGQGRVLGGAA